MPAAMLSFHDGEVLHVQVDDLSLDLPVLEVEVRAIGANSDRALVPLTAIRQLILGDVAPAPPDDDRAGWERAVFRFLDGQVLRAWISPATRLGRHGGLWQCIDPEGDEIRTIGIPYTSLKAVFRVHQWDSRSIADRGKAADAETERLARVLSERAEPHVEGDEGALLTRMQRGDHPG